MPSLRAVADEYGLPLVLTLHGYPLYESVSEGYSSASQTGRHYLMRSEMRALRLADAVVTVDTRLYRHALRLVPERSGVHLHAHELHRHLGLRPAETRRGRAPAAQLRATWDVPADKIVLFCPRRLVKKNGVIYPSLALATMTQDDRDRFLLLHAGEGGEREEIEAIVRENRFGEECPSVGRAGSGRHRDSTAWRTSCWSPRCTRRTWRKRPLCRRWRPWHPAAR